MTVTQMLETCSLVLSFFILLNLLTDALYDLNKLTNIEKTGIYMQRLVSYITMYLSFIICKKPFLIHS